jgi:hypothetical protein
MTTPNPTNRRALLGRGLLLPLGLSSASALLVGCGTPAVSHYAQERPVLDLKRYFDGTVQAQGLFIDRFGEVKRRFTVALTGSWQGEQGVLDEHFVYNDGEKERRVWRITALPGNRYRGEAGDVEGQADGELAGNTLRWRYRLRLPIQGRVWVVDVDDWMHLVDEQHLLNRAYFSKWGIALGEVQLSFQRAAAARSVSLAGAG